MLYRVRKSAAEPLYLHSGSGGSHWTKNGKVWTLPRNVVYAIEGSSGRGIFGYKDERGQRFYERTPWFESFKYAVIEMIDTDTRYKSGVGMRLVPISYFLRVYGKRWPELVPATEGK